MSCRSVWVVAIVIGLHGRAIAQPAEDRPWAVGVSEVEQTRALEIYQEGNAEFGLSRFAQAATKYREALQHWDHPSIHFNLAVSLINLNQMLDAYEHLKRSLVYGVPALGADAHAQALTYRTLLEGQLSVLRVSCLEHGAHVSLDGKELFIGPGSVDRVTLPGEHQVVATKPGFVTASEALTLVAGKQITHDVRLIAFKSTARVVRKWTPWKPWAVAGGGAALLGVGTILQLAAIRTGNRYDDGIAARCPFGCAAEVNIDDLRRMRSRAYDQHDAAVVVWAAGGAVVITGAVAVILNLPRTEIAAPIVTPTRGGGVLSLEWGF